MFEFIASVVGIYFIFKILDMFFGASRKRIQIREGDFIKEINGQYYLVRQQVENLENYLDETEVAAPAPHHRRPNLKVVK